MMAMRAAQRNHAASDCDEDGNARVVIVQQHNPTNPAGYAVGQPVYAQQMGQPMGQQSMGQGQY